MTDEEEGLKSFMESHFDFDSLKKIGFYPKSIKRTDYQKQADRICYFFGYASVLEYGMTNIKCHISTIDADFKCPICGCEQQVSESKYPVFKMNCIGCKRQLEVSPKGYWNGYHVKEVGGFKESTDTYDEKKVFIYNPNSR